jgi:hypothetical protein
MRRKSIIARKNHLRSPVSRAVLSGCRAKRLLRRYNHERRLMAQKTSASVVVWEVRFQEAPKEPSMAAIGRKGAATGFTAKRQLWAEAEIRSLLLPK